MLNCTLEGLKILIGHEFNDHDFLTSSKRSEARNLYVYFAIAILNKSFKEVNQTITFYRCSKTIYQTFRRQYEKRKDFDMIKNVNKLKKLIDAGR